MNKLQAGVIIFGLVMTVAMLVYPPWLLQDGDGNKHPMGYGWIWNPPRQSVQTPALKSKWINIDLTETRQANSLDLQRLCLQELGVIVVVFGFSMLSRKKFSA